MTVKFKFFLQHVTGVHWQCQTVPVLPGPHPDRDCHSHGENQRDRLSGPAVGHRRTSVFTTHWPGLITDVHATQVTTTTGSSATRILSPVFGCEVRFGATTLSRQCHGRKHFFLLFAYAMRTALFSSETLPRPTLGRIKIFIKSCR